MLRRQGKSLRQIKQILGPMSNATLNDALHGEPPPEWTRRPRAKDELRAKARELRTQGMDYEEIAAAASLLTGRRPRPVAAPESRPAESRPAESRPAESLGAGETNGAPEPRGNGQSPAVTKSGGKESG